MREKPTCGILGGITGLNIATTSPLVAIDKSMTNNNLQNSTLRKVVEL
jgi:hypothetical protein